MNNPKTTATPAPAKAAKLKTSPAGTPADKSEPPAPGGKLGTIVELLRRPGGATIHDIVAATGWQQHSIRGAFVGLKKRGFAIESQKGEGLRTYFISAPQVTKRPPKIKAKAAKPKARAR